MISAKPVKGFENYIIDITGEVFSIGANRHLKAKINKYGYREVTLFKKGKSKCYTVHRLVALHFIDNPANLPCVNHLDENKLNNNINNLEWVTWRENANYGTRNSRMSDAKSVKPVEQILTTGEVIRYKGVKDASRKTGKAHSVIANYCKSQNNKEWRYVNE